MCKVDLLKNNFGTAIILAGGRSSRMGFDKQFLKINEERLIFKIIEELKEEFNHFIIVSNKLEYYQNFPYEVIPDDIKNKGPLAGVYSGLKRSKSKYAYVIACDMPNINIEYIKYMKRSINSTDYLGVVTESGKHIEPFNSFYSIDLILDLETFLFNEDRRIYKFLNQYNILYISEDEALKFSNNWDMFKNLNTQEDIKKYLEN